MEFAAPAYGWLFLPVVLVFLLALRGERLRTTDLQRLARRPLLDRLLVPEPSDRRRLVLLTISLLLLVVALMRPQWGMVEELRSVVGLDIVVALDVSRVGSHGRNHLARG